MVNIPKFFKDDEADSPNLLLPLLPLRDIVIFPHMVAPLFVGREKSVNALSDAMNKDKEVFLATQRKAGVDNPGESDISHVGTIGKVLQLLRLPDGTVKALVEGKIRARIDRFVDNDNFFQVAISQITAPDLPRAEAEALRERAAAEGADFAELAGQESESGTAEGGGLLGTVAPGDLAAHPLKLAQAGGSLGVGLLP